MQVDLARYRELFVNRSDVFACQQSSGAYFPVKRELEDFDLEEHLAGQASYGTYTINPVDQTVRFVVFDLDTFDEGSLGWLKHCVEHLLPEGVDQSCLLLETSGGKGFHVWLFLSEPIEARRVRSWLEEEFWPEWKVLADEKGWPLEIFPKQDFVE